MKFSHVFVIAIFFILLFVFISPVFTNAAVYNNGNLGFILDKIAEQPQVQNGSIAVFTVNVTNNGTAQMANFSVVDEYNTSFLNFTSASIPPNYTNYTAGRVKWIFNISSGESFVVNANFTALSPGDTTNFARVFNETNDTMNSLLSEQENLQILYGYPIGVSLVYPENDTVINYTPFSLNYTVNVQANCTTYIWNSTGDVFDSGSIINEGDLSYDIISIENGTYNWNVYCFEVGNVSNDAWGNATNWTFIASIAESSDILVEKNSSSDFYDIGDTVEYSINITNLISNNLTSIWIEDNFDVDLNFTNESSCPVYNYSTGNQNIDDNFVEINLTQCLIQQDDGVLESGESFVVYLNFTAIMSAPTVLNSVDVNGTDNESITHFSSGQKTITINEQPFDGGLDQWQSSVISPYVIKNEEKFLNFSISRMASPNSCLQNLTIVLPGNFTYGGYNWTDTGNYSFIVNGNSMIWNATGGEFFCGEGPHYFGINVTSTDNYTSSLFQVISGSDDLTSEMNLTVFTTTTFWYNGTVYDVNGNTLEGATASLTVISFGEGGGTTLGTFSGSTDSNGVFNITDVPGLNASIEGGPGGPGSGDEDDLFYRLSVTKYNDSDNHYGMYVGPSLPELPESELRSSFGLNNPEIRLKPAVTFHVVVEGYDYRSGPTNASCWDNDSCGPNWEPEFNWTNIGYSYGLKDKKLGYPVSNSWASATERYFSAPLERNYSLMVFPESSFPIYIDFTNIDSKCNSTGYDISSTGVNANCTITNGTYLIDAVISSNMTILPFTGYINQTPGSFDDVWVVPYMLGSGEMLFDQDTLPFNMGNMMEWPANASLNDHYNLTTGEYTIRLPATEAHSDMMLIAFARKGSDYYADYHKISSEGQSFVGGSEYNFTLRKLITGTDASITSSNVSANWNQTTVVNTTAVQFRLVDENNTLLNSESSFVEMRLDIEGQEYKRMTDAQSGLFSVPILEGDEIEKLTIYSQSHAPISTPVSSSVLSGGSANDVSCLNGICNVTLRNFEMFDPDDPGQSLSFFIDFYKSNSTCDVPNPPPDCNLMQNINGSEFSPLKAILMGDISLRITSGNLSIHYVKTDLLASGPPDAAFSTNATGSGLEAAWKFGSRGPDVYEEVLIRMPYAPELENKNITVEIPVLYDNDFNIIWNSTAGNTTEQLNETDYSDYLNTPYEAYLNGTGVNCSTADSTLSSGLCFKDTTNHVIWIKIPHFTGVGVEVSGGGSNPANLTIWDSTDPEGGGLTKYPGDLVDFFANYTNTTGYPINESGAICNMSLNVSGGWSTYSMVYNSTSELYEYNTTFSSPGTFNWNVTCSSPTYTAMQANDNVTITKASSSCNLTSSSDWIYEYGTATTLTCSCTGDGTTHLYFNGVLHDDYNATSVVFAATTSHHTVVCNITEGTNYASNSTSNTLTISKADPSAILMGTNVTYPNHVNVTVVETNTGDSDITYELYRNGTTVSSANGTAPDPDTSQLVPTTYYYIIAAPNEGENYTVHPGMDVLYVTVFTGTLDLSISGTGTFTYPHETNVSASESNTGDDDVTYQLWRDSTMVDSTEPWSEAALFGAGTYTYRFNATGGQNWTANSTGVLATLTINQNQTNPVDIYFTNSTGTYKNQDMVVTYGEQITANVTAVYTNSGNPTLYRNGVSVSNPDTQTLSAGTYTYKGNITGNQNYTSNSTGASYSIIVNKLSTSCNLTSSNGWSYVYGNSTTLTCSCTGDGTTHLYFNGVLHDDYNATSVVFAANPSGHSVICNTTEGTNYASASTSDTLTINKTDPGANVMVLWTNATYPNHVNVTVVETNTGDADINYTLIRNGTIITSANGTAPDPDTSQLVPTTYYYIIAAWAEGENYTINRGIDAFYLTVFKGEIPVNLFFNNGTEYQNQNMTITYGTQSNITATSSAGTVFIYRDGVEITNGTSPQSEITTLGAGTYAYKVNATGNANYSDNSTGLTYYLIINKDSPTLSLTATSWSIYSGSSAGVSASESNTGDSDCNYTLYRDSTLVETGSSVSDTSSLNIGNYVYKYNTSGCANYTSGSTTNTLHVISRPSGGGGTPVETPPSKSQIWVQMTPGVAHIMKITNKEIGLKEVQVTIRNEANNVKITVKKLEGKPASVAHEISGKVYKYVEIDKQNIQDENIEKAKIRFEVSKSWLNENGYDPDSVVLERYTENGWIKLNTLRVGETGDSYIYEAETPGFSVFAIALATSEQPVKTTTTTIPPTTTTIQPTLPTPSEKPISVDYKLIGVVILVIILIVFLLLSFKGK